MRCRSGLLAVDAAEFGLLLGDAAAELLVLHAFGALPRNPDGAAVAAPGEREQAAGEQRGGSQLHFPGKTRAKDELSPERREQGGEERRQDQGQPLAPDEG